MGERDERGGSETRLDGDELGSTVGGRCAEVNEARVVCFERQGRSRGGVEVCVEVRRAGEHRRTAGGQGERGLEEDRCWSLVETALLNVEHGSVCPIVANGPSYVLGTSAVLLLLI